MLTSVSELSLIAGCRQGFSNPEVPFGIWRLSITMGNDLMCLAERQLDLHVEGTWGIACYSSQSLADPYTQGPIVYEAPASPNRDDG